MSKTIREAVPVVEMLAGLAEECCELAQAALKLRRVFDQVNPTPMDEETAIAHLHEEIADVELYLDNLDLGLNLIDEIKAEKQARWEKRLSGK